MAMGLLITYYNERELLSRSLRSIFSERFPPEEVLIYDDCSEFPCDPYIPAHLGSRVQVIRGKKNVGPAKGRNLLLQRTNADYVKFHDSDDELKSGWSDKFRKTIEEKNPDVILFEVDSWRGESLYGQKVLGLWQILQGMNPVSFAIHNAIVTSSAVYRREFLRKTGPYREDLWQSEDHEFHIRVLSHGPELAIIDDALLNLHVRQESRSQKQLEVWRCRLEGLRHAHGYLKPKYRQDLADAASEVGSILFSLGDAPHAQSAFAWARSVAVPNYKTRPWLYRLIARINPMMAERIGKIYRAFIPDFMRRLLH
jgi:glycosyltransferase involved in cell wall biosynthesis